MNKFGISSFAHRSTILFIFLQIGEGSTFYFSLPFEFCWKSEVSLILHKSTFAINWQLCSLADCKRDCGCTKAPSTFVKGDVNGMPSVHLRAHWCPHCFVMSAVSFAHFPFPPHPTFHLLTSAPTTSLWLPWYHSPQRKQSYPYIAVQLGTALHRTVLPHIYIDFST